MITTGTGTDGRPTLEVRCRRGVDWAWLFLVALLALNIHIMRDPEAAWPRSGRQIPEPIRVVWLWACVVVLVFFVLMLLARWFTTFPALRIANGRVMVYVAYRWYRFAIDDIVSVTPVMDAEKRSSSRILLGRRWFAFDYGGVTLAAIGSDTIHADIDELHQQVLDILGIEPTPLTGPAPWDVDLLGPHPIRRRLGLPVPAPERDSAREDDVADDTVARANGLQERLDHVQRDHR